MRAVAGAILVTLAVAGCSGPQAVTSASPSPAGSASTSPSPPSLDPSLSCSSKPVPGHPLVLLKAIGTAGSGLAVLDASDPLHPAQICTLNNANTGRFISETKIAFWSTQFLGTTDLATSSVNWSRAFLNSPSAVAFSGDGLKWAWQAGDDTTGVTTHLVVGGKDKTILTRAPIGGHGGPSWGPLNQLEFSADGKYLLTYTLFGGVGGPPNFIVFAMNGSIAIQSATAQFGVWTRTGSRLYFLAARPPNGTSGDVSSWDPGGQPVIRHPGLASYFWPTLAPDSSAMVFNEYDKSGLPHPWRLDLAGGGLVQLSSASSSRPVFVGPNVIWSTEEKPCACGPGGLSAPDGKVMAHDLQKGTDSLVGDFSGFTPSQAPTGDVLDVWLA